MSKIFISRLSENDIMYPSESQIRLKVKISTVFIEKNINILFLHVQIAHTVSETMVQAFSPGENAKVLDLEKTTFASFV